MNPPMEKPTTKNEGNQRNGHTAPGNETHKHANTDKKQKPRNGKPSSMKNGRNAKAPDNQRTKT